MKFIINRESILTPLQQIVSVIERKQTMPILSNVLMVLNENQLVLTGTDLEIQIVATVGIENSESYEITVPARKFLDICRLLPTGAEIKVEQTDDKIRVSSGRSRFMLSTLPAENFPEFSESKLDSKFHVNAGKLKLALEKTVFCMANQDVRYYLNGLLLHLSNSKIKLVASDGHRLSVFEDELEEPCGYEEKIIIPRKGVMELSRMIDAPDDELAIEFSGNNVRITLNNIVFSAKLVDARYPDFSRVFNQDFNEPIVVHRQTLKDALTRVAILTNDKFKGVSLDIAQNSMTLNSQNPEHEEAEESLPIEYRGQPLSIAFNVQYLTDATANLDSETVVINIAANLSSCIIEEPETKAYKFVVMPMRL